MIEIRVLTADDWPIWRELRLGALAEAPYAFGSLLADWQGEGDREERWRQRLSIPGGHDVVALLDGEPVGMASGVPSEVPGEIELISMWVSPAGRGRGVGDALMTEVERFARDQDADTLLLAVFEDNHQAVRLYARSGFAHTGRYGDTTPDGMRREALMAKPLAASSPLI